MLENNIEICAVILPSPHSPGLDQPAIYRREQPALAHSILPVLNSSHHTDIVQLAWQRNIPLWEVTRLSDPTTISILAAYQPDVICVSCFSLRIPRTILTIPRLGCLNVHPSLLPANRGPLPLFWVFRQGLKQSGVTIHFMDEGMDSGDIVAQETMDVPAGISYAQLESRYAIRGGELLAKSVWELYTDRAVRLPQDESQSSYHSFPTAEDYIVPVAEWSASRVYNFICGVAEWAGPVKLRVGSEYFLVRKAISYSLENIDDLPGVPYLWRGEVLWVRCQEGWVELLQFRE